MPTLRQSALAYAESGWPVFPCTPHGKIPLTGHGFKDASTDPDTIRAWWTKTPDANIGIATGAVSGLVVLDVDPRHGGDEALVKLVAAHGELPPTVTASTGGGGRHIYFSHPGGRVACSSGKLGPGLDLKGDGGYVVAPPSVHASGGHYAWVGEPEGFKPAAVPSWIVTPVADAASIPTDANPIPDGQRNQTLARLGGAMRRCGMGADEILAALHVTNRQRCVPPLPASEVERLAASVSRYEPDSISVALAEDHWGQMYGATHEPVDHRTIVRADHLEIRQPDWLLRGTLERDTLAMLFGDPGCGKSFLAIDWACRIATGTDWRGHTVTASPVVYVAGEGRNGLGRRLAAWAEHHDRPLDGTPLYVAPSVAITDVADVGWLIGAVEQQTQAPALVVLDTLARCFGGGDENSTQDMSAFVGACDTLRRRWGCTVLVVHHTGHGTKDRARGAMALKAALDAEYRLSTEGARTLTATKMKDAETPAPIGVELVTVTLHGLRDEYGEGVTSAAVEIHDADTSAIEAATKRATGRGRPNKSQIIAMQIAEQLAGSSPTGDIALADWHSGCELAGLTSSPRYRALAALQAAGRLSVEGDIVRLSESPNPGFP